MDNGNGEYLATIPSRIRQTLTAVDDMTSVVTYSVKLYSFGINGVFDAEAPGSDDCLLATETVTVLLDPTPVLTYRLVIGGLDTMLTAGADETFEICSGDAFQITDLTVPQTATNKANFVRLRRLGDDFLNVPDTNTDVPVSGFSVGAPSVTNTNPNGEAQQATIILFPYFEENPNGNNPQLNDEECRGDRIRIRIVLNPTSTVVPDVQDFTVCSEERVMNSIDGANSLETLVAGSQDLSAGGDFIIPAGAAGVPEFSFSISGANGGGTANGNQGGFGGTASGDNAFNFQPGDTIRVRKGLAGNSNANNGDGGDATMFCVFRPGAGNNPVYTVVAAGGGGAGFNEDGINVNPNNAISGTSNSMGSDGMDGAGFGGFGGTGFPDGRGGAGRNTGGGGGGGWNGGDGGAAVGGLAGEPGQSYVGGTISVINFGRKGAGDLPDGTASISYVFAFDDVRFSLVSRTALPMGVTSIGEEIVNGEPDTILFGQQFRNVNDAPVTIQYVFSTSTDGANCTDNGTVTVNLTVEPNPTAELSSGGTMITDNGGGEYAATICSGDSLSALLTSDVIPSLGANRLWARVVDVDQGPDISIVTTGGALDNASNGNGDFGGANQPSVADIPFFEEAIVNTGTGTQTVVYEVVLEIVDDHGATQCTGDTLTLTVSVDPGFDMVATGPIMFGLCSNASLTDAGFDLDATQPNIQIGFDSVLIDTVKFSASGMDPNFETINSVYNGSPLMVRRSADFFGGETYRNRVGAPVFVTYTVRLLSAAGCLSDPIDYEFRYTAEPVIEEMESVMNQIDTSICTGQTTGLVVNPAANSAWSNPADFQNNIDLAYTIDLPTGVSLTKTNGSYPAMGDPFFMQGDELSNTTNEPQVVTYTVTPSNNACPGDEVTYTVTVNPTPAVELTLTSGDSTSSFNFTNSNQTLNPNPSFTACALAPLTVTVTDSSSTDMGRLMASVQVTDPSGITDFTSGMFFLLPASQLGDTLSFMAGELVNTDDQPVIYTISYTVWFERNGTTGLQSTDDCGRTDRVEFDVIVNPTNEARVDVRVTDDNVTTPIPSGQDTLCSEALFDLAVRQASTIANDPDLPAIDSFLVQVDAPGLVAANMATETGEFTVAAPFDNPSFFFTRLDDLSWRNPTPGIKTVTYVATPYSAGCAGVPDTTTISFRPEILLSLDTFEVICTPNAIVFNANDLNAASSTNPVDYDWVYVGGDARNFILSEQNDAGQVAITSLNNNGQAMLPFSDTRFLKITTDAGTISGTAIFQLDYESPDGCTTQETLTMTITNSVSAGTPDNSVPVACEGNGVILLEDYLDNETAGGRWFRNDGAMEGSFNGTTGAFVANNLNGAGALLSYEFGYAVGRNGSGCDPDTAYVTVQVQSVINAGTYSGTPIEACQAAPLVNLFDALSGGELGGSFVQLTGTDNVFVDGNTGDFDQTNVTPGTYTYRYEVAGRNGCPGDDETVVVEVKSMADCSDPVPCDVIELTAGFNVIGFDVLPNDASVEAIFSSEIATDNLLSVFAIHPDESSSAQAYVFNPTFGTTVNTINSLRAGFGYIVEVDQATTLTVCGMPVDTSIRVGLQNGLNIVSYPKPGSESVLDYFSVLIDNNDLFRIRTVDEGVSRILRFTPFLSGNLTQVKNSQGYLLDVTDTYADGSWRDGNVMPTSNFDRLFGYTNLTEDMAGEFIRFSDAEGNVFGKAEVLEDGTYNFAIVYGDLAETERDLEGMVSGAEIFAEFRGERVATGATFAGNWELRQLDLTFGGVLSDTDTPGVAVAFSAKAYPNPTSGLTNLSLELEQGSERVNLEVYNTLGQVVLNRVLENLPAGQSVIDLDLTTFVSGAYQIRVVTDRGMQANIQIIRK